MAGISTFKDSSKELVVFGFVVGIGMVMLSELAQNSSITTEANTTITQIITGIGEFGSWVGLIVLIIVGTYLMKSMDKV